MEYLIDDKQINACCLNFVANTNGCKIAVGYFDGPSHGDRGRYHLYRNIHNQPLQAATNTCIIHLVIRLLREYFYCGIGTLGYEGQWTWSVHLRAPSSWTICARKREPLDLVSPVTSAHCQTICNGAALPQWMNSDVEIVVDIALDAHCGYL